MSLQDKRRNRKESRPKTSSLVVGRWMSFHNFEDQRGHGKECVSLCLTERDRELTSISSVFLSSFCFVKSPLQTVTVICVNSSLEERRSMMDVHELVY